MEWWEVLGCWNTIIENMNRIHEGNENYRKQGNITESFVKQKKVSDYAKEMRKKILSGEVK